MNLLCRLHTFGGMGDTLERRWRDGSLEFDLPVQVGGRGTWGHWAHGALEASARLGCLCSSLRSSLTCRCRWLGPLGFWAIGMIGASPPMLSRSRSKLSTAPQSQNNSRAHFSDLVHPQALAEMFNVNHFMVSQTNPHIVPLLYVKSFFPHKWAAIMEAELKHRWGTPAGMYCLRVRGVHVWGHWWASPQRAAPFLGKEKTWVACPQL